MSSGSACRPPSLCKHLMAVLSSSILPVSAYLKCALHIGHSSQQSHLQQAAEVLASSMNSAWCSVNAYSLQRSSAHLLLTCTTAAEAPRQGGKQQKDAQAAKQQRLNAAKQQRCASCYASL